MSAQSERYCRIIIGLLFQDRPHAVEVDIANIIDMDFVPFPKDAFEVKRGMVGIYQHVSERHLDRYLTEFDFRQNHREKLGVNDTQRAEIALAGAVGKRLTYQTIDREEAPPF